MKRSLAIGLGLLSVIVLFSIFTVFSFIEVNNRCITQEKSIEAQYKQNQNNYDNYFKKLKEVAQVPDMYSEDFKSIYDGIMKGRYGQEGSKAMFQWINENHPQLDSSLYKQIQQVVEAGRNDFETNQKMLLDKKRVYESYIEVFPNSFFVSILKFPKIKLEEYDIITSDVTEEIFKTKKSEVIDIR